MPLPFVIDLLIRRVHLATMQTGLHSDGQVAEPDGLGLIENGALAIAGGKICWLGKEEHLPMASITREIDGEGAWVTPGLIDCHTHLVYAGNRASEFEMRLHGASYESIARSGGGILSTVAATRAATEAELLTQSQLRLNALLADGVTTVEVKSGYGLSTDAERKMLRVARKLGGNVSVVASFLGAHALPPEYTGRADDYIDYLTTEVLPTLVAEGLVDAVDGFCEPIAFSRMQIERVFKAAQKLGLPVKLHAEQLSDSQGATLVAAYRGLSADHLEWLSTEGVKAMQHAGTVAVLLPGAFYFLGDTHTPPIDELRNASVPMAIATDCNPGSSPLLSLLLAMNMACTLFRLTPTEALRGVTCHAAQALGLRDRGVLAVGMRADLAMWKINRPAELCYSMGFNAGHHPLQCRIVNGELHAPTP